MNHSAVWFILHPSPIPTRRLTMNKLLARIVEAHRGLDRWRKFNRVEATIVTGGAFWGMKRD
jgi:hypothetical protein